MADKTLEQMLEHLVNNEQEKAEELFHEYVVAKSREIYESLVEDEVEEEEVEEATEEDEDAVEESTEEDEDAVEESTEEDEEEVSEELTDDDIIEADDEDMMGGDGTDKLAGMLDGEEEVDSEGEEEIFQDLEDIIGELQAKFDELKDHEEEEGEIDGDEEPEMPGDEEEEMKDDFDMELATVREYVEKIGAPSNTDTADNKKSIVDDMKNDMGGTTANIVSGNTDEKGRPAPKATEENAGNVNVPGGKAADSLSKESGGAATSESGADNTDSLFRGKRS